MDLPDVSHPLRTGVCYGAPRPPPPQGLASRLVRKRPSLARCRLPRRGPVRRGQAGFPRACPEPQWPPPVSALGPSRALSPGPSTARLPPMLWTLGVPGSCWDRSPGEQRLGSQRDREAAA